MSLSDNLRRLARERVPTMLPVLTSCERATPDAPEKRPPTLPIFEDDSGILAYALYKEDEDSVYLRQLFVQRRTGVGRQCMNILVLRGVATR